MFLQAGVQLDQGCEIQHAVAQNGQFRGINGKLHRHGLCHKGVRIRTQGSGVQCALHQCTAHRLGTGAHRCCAGIFLYTQRDQKDIEIGSDITVEGFLFACGCNIDQLIQCAKALLDKQSGVLGVSAVHQRCRRKEILEHDVVFISFGVTACLLCIPGVESLRICCSKNISAACRPFGIRGGGFQCVQLGKNCRAQGIQLGGSVLLDFGQKLCVDMVYAGFSYFSELPGGVGSFHKLERREADRNQKCQPKAEAFPAAAENDLRDLNDSRCQKRQPGLTYEKQRDHAFLGGKPREKRCQHKHEREHPQAGLSPHTGFGFLFFKLHFFMMPPWSKLCLQVHQCPHKDRFQAVCCLFLYLVVWSFFCQKSPRDRR